MRGLPIVINLGKHAASSLHVSAALGRHGARAQHPAMLTSGTSTDALEEHPELLGIGIDEGAWIEVHGNSFTVFGGRVGIYDLIRDRSYYFLSPGQSFDLRCVHVVGPCKAGDKP
jgi:hypothetical protein